MILAFALAVLAVPAGIGSAAQGGPVSLKTKGQYTQRSAKFCGKHKRIHFFHHNSRIEYRGFLMPATGAHFKVEIQVKRCSRGHSVDVAKYSFIGKRSGKFKGFFKAPRIGHHGRRYRTGYFFARAVINGQGSHKTYFAVTR